MVLECHHKNMLLAYKIPTLHLRGAYMKKRSLIIITSIIIAGAAAVIHGGVPSRAPATTYRTEPVMKGDLVQSISVNGTLNPLHMVKVGTEISGTIYKIYADFNQKVTQGEKLAEIEPSVLISQLDQSKALMNAAKAKLDFSQKNYRRIKALLKKDYVARQDMDNAEQDLQNAKAQMVQAEAQVQKDKASLEHTIIRSPISGIVISRDVDVGQTVAASFQTPELFSIAQDMKKMQITAIVSEADIGAVKSGVSVTFSVDAFPDRSFTGIVDQIRLNSNNQQDVVTYNVLVSVDNSDEALLPGMTALVIIPISQKKDVLILPNAALRFTPANAVTDSEVPPKSQRYIYLLKAGKIRPVHVSVGITNGKFSEVVSPEIKAGEQVIIEAITPE